MSVLKEELANDPETKGYAAMSDQEAADSLNAVTEPVARSIVPSHEVLEAISPIDLGALSALDMSRLQLVLTGGVDLSGTNTRTILKNLFDDANGSRAGLIALQGELKSRTDILGLPKVRVGHVTDARAT